MMRPLATLLAALVVAALLVPGAQSAPPVATKAEAISIVRGIVRRNAGRCKLAMKKVRAARIPFGWRVTVNVKVRGLPGAAAWHVKGGKANPADPFAKSIGKGCR